MIFFFFVYKLLANDRKTAWKCELIANLDDIGWPPLDDEQRHHRSDDELITDGARGENVNARTPL